MTGSTVVCGVSSVRLALLGLGVDRAVGAYHFGAVVLVSSLAVLALQACIGLSTDTNAVTNLDVLDVLSNADCLANDFMADTAGCGFCQ